MFGRSDVGRDLFCLESKIRHSTIDTVPYFYVQRLIKKYGVRYFYQRSIC